MMMLKGNPQQNRLAARHRGRAVPVVRCSSATVEPDASSAPQPRPRYATADGAAARQTRSFRRAQEGAAEGQPQQQQQQPKQMLPSVTFLEDDAETVARRVKGLFPKHFLEGNGALVRSLGRQGAAGAMRFLLAIREEAAAAAAAGGDQCTDLLVRLNPQEPIRYFGTPLMMFVAPVRGRASVLPAEDSAQCKDFNVSARTEPDRLAYRLSLELNNLQAGRFLRLNMVGTEALHRGLMALNDGLGRCATPSGSFFAVPELVTVPLRVRLQQEQQQEAGHQQDQQPGASAPAAAAAADESKRVQLVRLYVGRSRGGPGRAVPGAAAAAPPAASDSPAAAAVADSPAAAAAADSPAAADGKVLISESELLELRGALGNMMEQQKLLAKLIAEQQAGQGAAAGQAEASAQA